MAKKNIATYELPTGSRGNLLDFWRLAQIFLGFVVLFVLMRPAQQVATRVTGYVPFLGGRTTAQAPSAPQEPVYM